MASSMHSGLESAFQLKQSMSATTLTAATMSAAALAPRGGASTAAGDLAGALGLASVRSRLPNGEFIQAASPSSKQPIAPDAGLAPGVVQVGLHRRRWRDQHREPRKNRDTFSV